MPGGSSSAGLAGGLVRWRDQTICQQRLITPHGEPSRFRMHPALYWMR